MVTTRRGTATDPNTIKDGGQQAAAAAGVKRSASAAGNKEKKETKPAKKEAAQDVKQAEQEEEKVEGSVTVAPTEKAPNKDKSPAPAPAPEVEMKDAAPAKQDNDAPAAATTDGDDDAKKREEEDAEQKRKEEEAQKLAEETQRKEEERKKAAEEQQKKEEEAAAEAKRKEEERERAEAERKKREEEEKQAAEKKAEEERQKAEEARKEEERKAEEVRKADEQRRQEEERKKEEERQREETRRKEEEEQRKRDEERKQQEEEQQRKKEEEQRKEEERKKQEEQAQSKANDQSAQPPSAPSAQTTQPSAAPSTTPGSTQQTSITQFSQGGGNDGAAPKADGANHHSGGAQDTSSMPSHAKQDAVVSGERKPADEILEKGQVYFFFRARVDETQPESAKDIARVYVILRPFPKDAALAEQGNVATGGRNRVIVLPKKILPQSLKDRFMAFVELAGASMSEVQQKVLQASEYQTQTQGTRHVQPAKPIGEGVYALTQAGESRRETHLAYSLTMPVPLTEVQREFGIEEQGSFIVSAKNPKFGGPSNAQLPEPPKFPESILSTFGNYRWSPAQPAMLDYANAQFLLIGSSKDNELADAAAPAAEELEKLENEDAKRVESLKRDHAVFADLGLSKQHPGLQRSW